MKQRSHTPSTSTIAFAVLVLVTFFTALYMKGLNSGIPLYYDSIGYSATIGGTFVTVFTLASTVMRLVGGQLTDHFPHYRVLMASLGGLLLGVAIPAVCSEFWMVMVARVIQGASFALATNVMTVAVMGTTTLKHMGKRVGLKGAGTSLGTMLGALVATGLLDGCGCQGFYGFYAALMALALATIFLLHRMEKRRAKEGCRKATQNAAVEDGSSMGSAASASAAASGSTDAARSAMAAPVPGAKKHHHLHDLIAPYLIPQVAPYLAISFARRIPKGFCIAFVLIFARAMGIAGGALFFVAAGGTTLLCRLCGGRLFDSSRTWLLWPLISVQIIGFAALAIAPSFATLIVAAVGYGISVGTTSPFIKTLTAKSAPKEHWGVVNGELYFFGDLGKALGAFLGGIIIDATSKALMPEIALGIAVFASAVTAVALLVGRRMTVHPAK